MAPGESNIFPAGMLRAIGGEIYSQIFENRHANVPRQLLWDVRVEFAPVRYGSEDFSPSLSCGFIPWKFRDWRSLTGASFEKQDPKRNAWAGTFYTGEHNPAHEIRLRVAAGAQNRFRMSVEMSVDLPEYGDFDRKHEAKVSASVEVAYTGLYLTPGNLFPKPATILEVQRVASGFIDVAAYHPPEPWGDHTYLLRPIAGL